MKTTVVPAQITTVEDRIAGSLTLPQIVLMVISLVIGVVIYAGIPPKMHLSAFKMTFIVIQFAVLGILAIRFNGKIVADWLIIFLRYKSRPNKYVFTKNDLIYREIVASKEVANNREKQVSTNENKKSSKPLTLLEELNLKKILASDSLSLSFKPSKKGGMDVALEQK